MINELFWGTAASLLANGIQGGIELISKDSLSKHLKDALLLAEKDLFKEYTNIISSESFLARQENIDIICDWILNDNINTKHPELKKLNYDESVVTEEQVNYFFKRVLYYIKNDAELRNYVIYEVVRDTNNKLNNLEFIKNNIIYAKNFVEQIGMIDNLFMQFFKFSLWKTQMNIDCQNYLFSGQGNSINTCFMNMNALFQNLNREIFNSITEKSCEDGMESLVYLLKSSFQDKSYKINEHYNKVIKHIMKLFKECSFKSPNYYNALGQLQIDLSYDDNTIYINTMSNLIAFNEIVIELLKNVLKTRNYEEYDIKTLNFMHQHLFADVKHQLTPEIKKYIKVIYDRNEIIDTDLAGMFSISIYNLRKELYPLTGSFLEYRYNDHGSTKLMIKHYYRSTFEKYYSRIFDEVIIE